MDHFGIDLPRRQESAHYGSDYSRGRSASRSERRSMSRSASRSVDTRGRSVSSGKYSASSRADNYAAEVDYRTQKTRPKKGNGKGDTPKKGISGKKKVRSATFVSYSSEESY